MTLIAAPLAAELRVLGSVFEEYESSETPRGSRDPILFPRLGIALFRGGHGKAEFAARTAWVLAQNPRVEQLLVVGTAGSLSSSVHPGDIVVATETIEHDYTERFDTNAKLPSFPADPDIGDALERVSSSWEPALPSISSDGATLHRGRIASGDEDIVEPKRARELAAKTGALAVAWEGAGGARAARVAGIPWCEIRAISDTADSEASTDFLRHLDRTMSTVGQLLLRWLTS